MLHFAFLNNWIHLKMFEGNHRNWTERACWIFSFIEFTIFNRSMLSSSCPGNGSERSTSVNFFHVGRVDSSFLGYLSELLTDRVPRSKYHGHGSKQKCCEANMPPNANLDLGSKLAAPLFQYPVLCLWPVEAQLHLAHPTHILYMLWLHFFTIGIDHTDLVQNELRHLQNLCLRILPTKLLTQWSFRQKDHATIHAINVVTCHEKNLGSGPWHPFGVPPNQHN